MEQHSRLPLAASSKSNPPWYDRRTLEGFTTQFGPNQKDRFAVFLTQDAVVDLHLGTYQQIPSESFGLLMGRVYMDDIGIFTVVERVFYARKLEAGPGHVQLSPEAVHELRLQATRKHPAMDFVGWTHSHDRVSQYSQIDYQEQQTWDEPYHIGILTFMDGVMGIGKTWAVMYRGPSAQTLSLVVDATPGLRKNNRLPAFAPREKQKTQEFVTSQEALKVQEPMMSQQDLRSEELTASQPKLKPRVPNPDSEKQPSQGLKKRLPWRVSRRAFFSAILAFILIVVGVVVGNFLTLGLQPVVPTSSSTNLLWDCNQQSGSVPLSVTCSGPVGPNIQGWSWDFGDGTTIQKSTATHVYHKSGTYKITLIVIASTSQRTSSYDINAGSLTIQVGP